MAEIYNDPAGGSLSSVGPQIRTDFYAKKALVEVAKDIVFGALADTTAMPKNFGKTIKRFHYLPILDDANQNDQGIDAAGLSTNYSATFTFTPPTVIGGATQTRDPRKGIQFTVVGYGASGAAAIAAAKVNTQAAVNNAGFAWNTNYVTTRAALIAAGWTVKDDTSTPAITARFDGGNLYGSSKDVGTIAGKIPTLTENGGRVNRVGSTRIQLSGSIHKYGIFEEYTQESLDFDTDAELLMHKTSEIVKAANEINEDLIQSDLLNAAGVVYYGGAATSLATVTGEATPSLPTYQDLMNLEIILDNNRCPKSTKMITGSRMIDTRVVEAARFMYIGSELIPVVKNMVNNFGYQAFIPTTKYAATITPVKGEIGSIGGFRIIVAQEMQHWEAAGATVSSNLGYRTGMSGGTEKYNVYPMLVVGDEAFTTIGFQTDGKGSKFSIKHIKPGSDQSYNRATDPFGEVGFISIKWYYGSMILRPERIACMKVVAPH